MDAMSMETEHDMHMGQDMHMGNMALHMAYTELRPENAADDKRADEIVATLKQALAKYREYHVAEADGFKPFHPEIKKMKVVHFTKIWYGLKAAFTFNRPLGYWPYEHRNPRGWPFFWRGSCAPRLWLCSHQPRDAAPDDDGVLSEKLRHNFAPCGLT